MREPCNEATHFCAGMLCHQDILAVGANNAARRFFVPLQPMGMAEPEILHINISVSTPSKLMGIHGEKKSTFQIFSNGYAPLIL